ncbi:NAD kinase [Glycomyces harbinensis]|uniref:NAD kinase n=1 Tax=Glycomyces harbinensis TaxID=58114 RepID=A0A1G6ZQV5_9ACTN|nr:NAD kinase [Glycomyces harbinensis]SDE04607.1 NAD+ kinase [Glycomyces harbinensis]
MGSQQKPGRVLVVTHPLREDVAELAEKLAAALRGAGVAVRILTGETRSLLRPDALVIVDEATSATADLILALGGDGTVLRSAKIASEADIPLLGVNFGKVGFLAEAETGELETVVSRLLDGEYTVEERTALSVEATGIDGETRSSWAFNDIAVEKAEPARMLELFIEIDGTRISRYGCDGVVVATPTGSTAHAMSAGGPVVWPDVDALVVVPMNAHALFAKPMVVHSSSEIRIGVESVGTEGALIADGKELTRLTAGGTVTIRRSERPVKLVRMSDQPFASRLVSKLSLPVDGWRHGRI